MAPLSQGQEPPGNPGRFKGKLVRGLADDAPPCSGVAASDKPGAVQPRPARARRREAAGILPERVRDVAGPMARAVFRHRSEDNGARRARRPRRHGRRREPAPDAAQPRRTRARAHGDRAAHRSPRPHLAILPPAGALAPPRAPAARPPSAWSAGSCRGRTTNGPSPADRCRWESRPARPTSRTPRARSLPSEQAAPAIKTQVDPSSYTTSRGGTTQIAVARAASALGGTAAPKSGASVTSARPARVVPTATRSTQSAARTAGTGTARSLGSKPACGSGRANAMDRSPPIAYG